MNSQPYIDYLDKEMTIMGILSFFCLSVIGVVLKTIFDSTLGGHGIDSQSLGGQAWLKGSYYITWGTPSLLAASLSFYRQRSRLAWYLGQICLSELTSGYNGQTDQWLRAADGWSTWIYYRWAFAFMTFGFVQFGLDFLTVTNVSLPDNRLWTIYAPA